MDRMAAPSSERADVPPAGSPNRIDSWKEIAAYLRRSVPTVQRWEKKEALPVRRHAHEKLGSVFAYKSELDDWWRERSSRLSDEDSPESPQAVLEPALQPPRKKFVEGALVVGLLASVLGASVYYVRARATVSGPAIRSLAVLPLANLSGDPHQDYFAEGMTEELTTSLGKVSGIAVMARTAVMRYQSTKKPPSEIARELGVEGLVEGSVLRSNGNVRITVHLIDPTDSRQLWAEGYEGDVSDVLALQADMARDIATAIKGKLTASDTFLFDRTRPVDPEAIDDYWKGMQLLHRGGPPDGPRRALSLFQAAITREPRFAQAYAATAEAYDYIGGGGFLGPEGNETGSSPQAFAKAEEAARRAMELDPLLAEAHHAMGSIHASRYNWNGLMEADRNALKLNPNHTASRSRLAMLLGVLGRHDEALAQARKARDLDPLDESLGLALFHARRYEEAINECRRVLEAGGPPGAGLTLARIYLRVKRFKEAMASFAERRAFQTMPGSSTEMQNAFAVGGGSGLAAWLAEFYQRQTYRPIGPWQVAWYYAIAGDKEHAFVLLERASDERRSSLNWSLADPGWDGIRSDPRFRELLRSMNLPESLTHPSERDDRSHR
jgi:TolB-like protein